MEEQHQTPNVPEKGSTPTQPIRLADYSSSLAAIGIVLYAIGFLIWECHLSSYGISAPSIFQGTFVSAGAVYAFFLSVVALPPAFAFHTYYVKAPKTLTEADTDNISIMSILWLLLLTIGLPRVAPSLQQYVFGMVPICLYVVTMPILNHKWIKTKWCRNLNRPIIPVLLIAIGIIFTAYQATSGLGAAVFSTLFYGPILLMDTHFGGKSLLAHQNLSIRILSLSIVMSASLANVVIFATKVFPEIPSKFGGGRLQTAFISFREDPAFEPWTHEVEFTNGFYGPLKVLLQSGDFIWIVGPDRAGVSTNKSALQIPLSAVEAIWYEAK